MRLLGEMTALMTVAVALLLCDVERSPALSAAALEPPHGFTEGIGVRSADNDFEDEQVCLSVVCPSL
jgi:hypothetical protein